MKICTIARWVKEVLRLSGIDISQFPAHSTRSASTSTAFRLGVPISDIMKVAEWTQAFTFKKFYQKPIKDSYGVTFCHLQIPWKSAAMETKRMLCKIIYKLCKGIYL